MIKALSLPICLSIFLFGSSVFAGDNPFAEQVTSHSERLYGLQSEDMDTGAGREKIFGAFEAAAHLTAQILNNDEIPDEEETKLLDRLGSAVATAFERINEGLLDPIDHTAILDWHDQQTLPYVKPFTWFASRLAIAISGLFGRDLGSLVGYEGGRFNFPPSFVPFSPGAQKQALLSKIVKAFSQAFDDEFKEAETDQEKTDHALSSLKALLDKFLSAESVRFGPLHRSVSIFYLGLGTFFFINPIELWIERTEYGPPMFAVLEASFFAVMYRVRIMNSGLAAFRKIQRLRKRAGLAPLNGINCKNRLGLFSPRTWIRN